MTVFLMVGDGVVRLRCLQYSSVGDDPAGGAIDMPRKSFNVPVSQSVSQSVRAKKTY